MKTRTIIFLLLSLLLSSCNSRFEKAVDSGVVELQTVAADLETEASYAYTFYSTSFVSHPAIPVHESYWPETNILEHVAQRSESSTNWYEGYQEHLADTYPGSNVRLSISAEWLEENMSLHFHEEYEVMLCLPDKIENMWATIDEQYAETMFVIDDSAQKIPVHSNHDFTNVRNLQHDDSCFTFTLLDDEKVNTAFFVLADDDIVYYLTVDMDSTYLRGYSNEDLSISYDALILQE